MARTIYLIVVGKDDNPLEDEFGNLLFFDNIDQIADFCVAEGLDFEQVRISRVNLTAEVVDDEQ